MPRTVPPIKLRRKDSKELKQLIRSKKSDGRLAFRAGIILMAADGSTNIEIGRVKIRIDQYIAETSRPSWASDTPQSCLM